MSMSSGSSSTQSTQPYILSGLDAQASSYAAMAQVQAAQIAAQAASQNTTSAIQALMTQYSTSLTYSNPQVNTGNQAEAQMNYMLGLPAVSPGAAPTAPTAPDYGKDLSNITHQQVLNYVDENGFWAGGSSNNKIPNSDGNSSTPGQWYYTGVGDNVANGALADGSPMSPQEWQGASYNNPQAAGNTTLDQTIQNYLANQTYQTQMDQYNAELPAYQDQLAQYNQQLATYNQYQAKGIANASDIQSIINSQPGFAFDQQQGIQAIQNAGSASGMLNSGNILESLNEFGQGLSDQFYQSYMGNLASLAGMGAQASSQSQAASTNLGQSLASAFTGQGTNQANSALAAGQATASMFTNNVDNQEVRMFPYTTSSKTSSSSFGGGLGDIAGLLCDETIKEEKQKVSTKDILDSVDRLRIEKWKYKEVDETHLGPYAQDFKEIFGVGDGKSINMIDLFGVLLGSIKELSLKVKQLQENK